MEYSKKRESLKDFFYEIRNCSKCQLSQTRTNFVFGSGSADAKIMFVGEAPGKNEDLQGKPFVGQAGKLLDDLLGSIGLSRGEVFIANVLKCRPPLNRDPRIEEINICKGYLFKQIEIIDPIIICTLGRHSTQLMLNTDEGISKLRGKVFKIKNRYILPINHPAAVLYTPSRLDILKEDFLRLKKVMLMTESYDSDTLNHMNMVVEEFENGIGELENKDFSKTDNLDKSEDFVNENFNKKGSQDISSKLDEDAKKNIENENLTKKLVNHKKDDQMELF